MNFEYSRWSRPQQSQRSNARLSTRPSGAARTRCSSGAAATGRFCSSSRRSGPRPRSRLSPARTSVRSTGRIDGSVIPELQRLFTFPDDFAFVGRRASVQAQIGNAVPPLLARQVADCVARAAR
ncbi:MAG: DNA cytosine methyltransferase [Acidimicrobiales bacterium]